MELKGKKVLVVGLGKSGLAAALFLRHKGAQVTVSDVRSAESLAKEIPALLEEGIAEERLGLLPEALEHIEDACELAPDSQQCGRELQAIREKLTTQPQEHVLIIDAHRLMMTDPQLRKGAENFIRTEQINAEWSIQQTIKQITAAFETFRDARRAPNAAFYESQLPAARALVEKLRKG